jgi:hypothetical protein
MAELIKVNKKVINDPLFTPVIAFLKERIANLEINGPEDELALSKQRYDGLVAGDLVIESAVRFPDNVVRVCIISRKTGFARVDLDIKYAKMKDILEDFTVPLVEIEDVDHLKTYVKANSDIEPTLLYLKYKDTYGVLITQDQAKTHEGPMTAFGNLFFENYTTTRESLNSIDWESLECGTVTITDPSFGQGVYPLFIYELVLAEAQLPEITSNLPTSITSRRGETFDIPNTYWFAGTQDITTTATVELSTKLGYANLERSSDLLQIDGETIYGSADQEITDTIVVRVSYDWNGKLVRKNFYIELKIEKDLPSELVITSVPTEVKATSGDIVELTLTAKLRGDKVEILIPPTMLRSQKGFGNLAYVKTNKDLTMVYRGKVNVSWPRDVEQVADLWYAEFSYNDAGTIIKNTAYINSILVKPETLPAFTVTGVPTLLQGYKNQTGKYKPTVMYGEQEIALTQVQIDTGVQGSKQLVDITEVTDAGVSWKLIDDSQTPGTAIRDSFTQTYEWLDPRGVLQTKSFVIQVNVLLDSIVELVPVPPQPRNVVRYQTGGPTFTFMVNGTPRSGLIRTIRVDPIADPKKQYIVNNPKANNQWMVALADETGPVDYTANFTITALVDGVIKTYKFPQEFIIAKYVPGTNDTGSNTGPGGNTGPTDPTSPGGEGNPNSPGSGDGPYNTNIKAEPLSYSIGDKGEKSAKLTFKVLEGTTDITADCHLLTESTVTPSNVSFDNLTYDADNNVFVVDYTKLGKGQSEGAVFACKKADANPAKVDIARIWINTKIGIGDGPPVDDSDPDNPGGGPAPGETGTGPGGSTGPTDPTEPGGDQNPDSPGEGDGPYNADITAVPTSFTIGGESDKNYKMSFKIFQGTEDVTAKSEIMSDYTVLPEFVTLNPITYDATNNVFVMTYTKDKGGESQGAIFAKLKATQNPTKKEIARVWLNVNITQTKILKVINPPKSINLDVGVGNDFPLTVEFSGKEINLLEPGLTIEKTPVTDTRIEVIDLNAILLMNDTWSYVGTTNKEVSGFKLTYVDPEDKKEYTTSFPFDIYVTYPALELKYTGPQEINAKIWDTGTFPIQLIAGTKDFTSSIVATSVVTGKKYVSVNKLDWDVILAESTATSQIVGLNIGWRVGKSSGNFPADFKFNLAAWDGITFAETAHSPEKIEGASGDKGEFTASFIYKGKDATATTKFDKASSTIPDTVILGTPAYDADKGLVIPYELTLGGDFPMTLVFVSPSDPDMTVSINVDTSVAWPDDINIVNKGDNVRGYWNDSVTYPLVINVAGTPVNLTDANLSLNFSSGDDNPIELTEAKETSLILLLAKGGDLGTSYDYTITIDLEYTNQATGKVYNKQIEVPATIRVPDVKATNNPTINANVFDIGKIPVTLVDERGKTIEITKWGLSGAGTNVILMDPSNWYITNGSTIGSVPGELPLRLGYTMGGVERTIDVLEKFTIAKWDGVYFKATTKVVKIEGNGGDTGEIPFEFTYQGLPSVGVTLDRSRSDIPDNIAIGELDDENNLTYTLSGQDEGDLKLCFVRPDAIEPMQEGRDYALVSFSVKTTSTNLPFTLESSDNKVDVDWGKTATVKFVVKYGDKVVPNDTPGLKITLADAAVHGISIQKVTKDGIEIKGIRSDVAGSTKSYAETFNVSYEVGAPEPKQVSFDTTANVSMGAATIFNNNDVKVKIWDTGSFAQVVQFNGITLNTIDHFEIQNSADNKYIEVTPPRGYEVIGAEIATGSQEIPMTVYYRVDGTTELQKLDFKATFTITGSTSVRFKVTPSPTKVEGSLNNESVVRCTPIYKDKPVGGRATFKPALSTIPPQLTLKDFKVVNNDYVITFVGAKGGLATMDLVFWAPDVTDPPKARDVATATFDVKVMGELGLEIGTRDNLLTGKNADTGTYRLQILFGGIPIDAAADIASGNLTATREAGVPSSMNANVITIDKWNAESYDYTLAGCVQPNATVNVSDFINLTYKYGGTNYTRRVEIPLKYTSSTPDFTGWPTAYLKVFSKGTLSPTVKCDGVTINGINSIANYGDTDDAYVTLGGTTKQYEIFNGDTVDITHLVHARVIGLYRNWTWTAEIDIPFNILAWNQRTWDPTLSGAPWSVYMDLTGTATRQVNLTAYYRNGLYSGFSSKTGDLIYRDKTDLLGLVGLDYSAYASATTQFYRMTAKKPGKGTLKLSFRNPESTTVPGKEGVDYTNVDYDVEVKENTLIGSTSGTPTGGNGDTATITLVVRQESNNSQIQNTNQYLEIATVNEDVFKITSKAASTITVLVTAPLSVPDGVVNVPMTFKYTDPNTGFVTKGTFDYPFIIKRPSDYPTVRQTNTVQTYRLFDYGPNPFTVTSEGQNVSAKVIPISCNDTISAGVGTGNQPPYMEMSYNDPVDGNWFWITKVFNVSQSQGRVSEWVIRVPYRGSTVDITARFSYNLYGGTNITEFYVAANQSKFLTMKVGDQVTLPFTIKYRNLAYGKAVFKPDAVATEQGYPTPFSENYKFIKQEYDPSTQLTNITFEVVKLNLNATVPFIFDLKADQTNPVMNSNRGLGFSVAYGLTITPSTDNIWNMWQTRFLSGMVSIKDGSTELVSSCTVLSVSSPLFVQQSTGVNPRFALQSDVAIPAQKLDVVYEIQLPAAYFNTVIKVTIPANINEYDGVEFYIERNGSGPSWPVAAIGSTKVAVDYLWCYYRGSRMTASLIPSQVTSTTAALREKNKDVDGGSGLIWNGMSYNTSSNLQFLSFSSGRQINGKDVVFPIDYKGPGYDNYPVGTKGKNYFEYTVPAAKFYENALYPYPSDKVIDQVQGSKGDRVNVPITFTVGKDFTDNPILPGNLTSWVIINASDLAGVVSKPSSNPNTATGIVLQVNLDNRGDDVLVNVPIRFTYNTTYRGTSINSSVDMTVPLLIKGTGTGDQVVVTPGTFTNSRVWDVSGPALAITVNGVAITYNQITDIQIAPNPYIRRPEVNPNTTSRWFEIYNGKTDGPTQTTATFTVTFNDGARTRTITQDVPITIQKYSGSPWAITVMVPNNPNNTTYNIGLSGYLNSYQNLSLMVYYKNAALTEAFASTIGMDVTAGSFDTPGFSNPTTQQYYYVTAGNTNPGPCFQILFRAGAVDTLEKKAGKIKFGFLNKLTDPNSVEGQDWVYVDVSCLTYVSGKTYIYEQGVTEFTSKYTNPITKVKLPFKIRRDNQMVGLNVTSYNPALSNQGNLALVFNESDVATNITVGFNAELVSQKQQTLDTIVWIGNGQNNTLSAQGVVRATQISNYDFPTVGTVNSVNAQLNQRGGLPFTLKDDSGNDITSTATITAISTNDYVKLDSGQWLCYSVRSADTQIQVTFTYQLTYKGNLLTMKQDVPFVIKPFTGQPTVSDVQVVNGKVWDIGSKIPFTININGNPVPSTWITALTGTSANNRVQVTSLAEPWYIVAGSKDAAVSDTVSYVATVTDGTNTWTVKQDVVFNIAKYDGVELSARILTSGGGNAELQTVFYPYNATSIVGIIFNLYSKGRLVANTGIASLNVGKGLVASGTSASGANATCNIKGNNTVSGNTETSMTVQLTIRGSAATTEGIDILTVTIPVFMVQGTGQLLVHPRTTKAMTGKYGTPVSLDAYLIKYVSEAGSRFVDLTTGNTTITFAPSDVITLVPGSITAQGYKVNFASRLYADTVKDVVVTVTNGGVSKTYTLNTTQLASPADQPDVKDNNGQTASVNQSGAMPFKLVDPDTQEDVTSKATISSIASNDYIELVNGKWYAKKDVATDTHTNVTFTLTLNYRDKDIGMDVVVDFLIKPFDGKFTVTDKKDITAKVWDRGTVPPFGLSVNGNPVPTSWITSWETSPTDTYVAVAANGSWQVIAGDQTKGVTVTVGYAANITVPGGNTTKNVTQVTFNISQYDGIEFKLNLANLQAGNKELQAIFLTYNASSTNGIYFEGRYRGDLVPSPIGVSLSGGYLRIGNGPINGASSVAWAVQPSGAPARGTAAWTARIKRASSAGNIENSDVASLPIPAYFVVGAGDMFVHTGTTKTASGKKGDQLDLVLNMFRYSGTPTTTTLTDLTAGSTTVEFSPANVIELVPGSITAHGYKVRFINTLYQDTNTQVTATVKTASGNVSYVIDVTQLASPAAQPDVVGNNTQTAGINQTGTMPFKLVDPDTQEDVTSAATVTSVDSNPYVEWVDGKWRVKSDVSADTHSDVTFNLTITYRGITSDMHVTTDFLIKPFDGVFTFGNVEPISGNVWDRGTAIDMGIKVNGNAIPVDWITGYLATPESNYVTVGANGVWQIVAGSKDEAITETVGYTATVAVPGTTSYPATVQVTYNIGKYDGVEFKLRLTNLNADDVLFGQAGLAARGYLEGRYRNDLIGGTSGYGWTVITRVNLHPTTPISGVNLSGSSKIYDFNTVDAPAARAQNVVRFVRPGGKDPKTDNTAVKDVDYVDMVIPITTWKSDTLVAGQTPDKFEGKLGDVLDVRANAYYSSTRLSLDSSVLQITPDASLGIEIVPDSITADGFKVRFVADVTEQTTVASVITYKYTNGSTTGTATPAFTVVQNPGDVSPDVNATGTMAPMKYGETGNIVLTGTVGSDALAGKVTFVPESSDNKGLVTFGDPVNNEDGTVSIPVTADKVGKDNLTIHITVNGATGNVSGKDYLDVIVAAEVTYGDLGEGDGFETNATGTSGEPVTVIQWTYMPEE